MNHGQQCVRILHKSLPSPHTRRAYRRDVEGFCRFLGDAWTGDFAAVEPGHVLAWRDWLRQQGLRGATVSRRLATLSSLFMFLCEQQVVAVNPVASVRRPRSGDSQETPRISDDQARRLLDAPPPETVKGKRDRAILAVLLYGGLRREEVCQLRVSDVRQDRGVAQLRVSGKGSKARDVELHPVAARAIDTYLQAVTHGDDLDGPLFRPVKNPRKAAGRQATAADIARGLHPDSVYKCIVKYYGAKVGINAEVVGFCVHTLRGTAATNALEHGADLRRVQDWLGHADIATTRRRYDKRRKVLEESPTFKVKY